MTPRTGPKTTILLHFRKNAHSRRLSTQKLLLQTTCEICGLVESACLSWLTRGLIDIYWYIPFMSMMMTAVKPARFGRTWSNREDRLALMTS